MDFDGPSAQLQHDLEQSLRSAYASRRPILHHLNADSSWLLQIPRPETAVRRGARCYFNLLIDPWFVGPQSDVASWFSQQFHAEPSSIQSISELEDLIYDVETLATDHDGRAPVTDRSETYLDALAISHEFTDHCHKETLVEIHPDVPVFAIKEAADLIRGWKHFRTVIPVDTFGRHGDMDWRSTSILPLPEWIGISRMLQKDDVLNYHAALLITFNNRRSNAASKLVETAHQLPIGTRTRHHAFIEPDESQESAEAILYTPHGIYSGDLDAIANASPPISTLAFLHGLHNVRVGTASGRTALQSNLGAHNGLKAQRMLNAKYWIGTHDEVKKGGGLVAWFLQRDAITLQDALEQELRGKGNSMNEVDQESAPAWDSIDDTHWLELRNGESRVLE